MVLEEKNRTKWNMDGDRGRWTILEIIAGTDKPTTQGSRFDKVPEQEKISDKRKQLT